MIANHTFGVTGRAKGRGLAEEVGVAGHSVTIVFFESKQEQVPCICWCILHILLEMETFQHEKQELQKQMQEAAATQAESRLERGKLSFALVKTAHILRLDRSYMLEEGLQSLATRCSYSCIAALFCQTLHSHVSLSQHVCL